MIKVGFCVAYDWKFLEYSIPLVYDNADIICLAIDIDRKSWSGAPYNFDNSAFFELIRKIDPNKKISIYEDNFHLPELSAMKNDTRQRMLLAEQMGKGGWHIQVDSDEYFLDFKSFVQELRKIHKNPTGNEFPINVCCPFIPLYKKTNNGYLYVTSSNKLTEIIPMATTLPNYERARQNGYFNIYSKQYVIHDTWARTEQEMKYKIDNWGHASEELDSIAIRNAYFNLWKSIDENNYQYLKDFHPAVPKVWERLQYIEAKDTHELLQRIIVPEFPLSKIELYLKNSVTYSRIKKLFHLILRK